MTRCLLQLSHTHNLLLRYDIYTPDVRVLDVQGRPEADGVLGAVVGEDDRAHRGLARPGLAHQQDLLLTHCCCSLLVSLGRRSPLTRLRPADLG